MGVNDPRKAVVVIALARSNDENGPRNLDSTPVKKASKSSLGLLLLLLLWLLLLEDEDEEDDDVDDSLMMKD